MDKIIKKLKEIDCIEGVENKYKLLKEVKFLFNKKINSKIEKLLKSSDDINLLCGIHVEESVGDSYVYKQLLNILKKYDFKKSGTSWGFKKDYGVFSISVIPNNIYQYYNIEIRFECNYLNIIKESKDMESFFNKLDNNLDNLNIIYSDIENYFSKKETKLLKRSELKKSFKNNLEVIEKHWFSGVRLCEEGFFVYVSTDQDCYDEGYSDCYVEFIKAGVKLGNLICFYPENIKDVKKIIYFSKKIYNSILKI